jgi:hypothetical protein
MRFFPILCYYLHHFKLRDFHVSSFYSPDFKLHEVFRLYFTPFLKIWSSHILSNILCNEELLINRAGMVNRLETCLSLSFAVNLFVSFNYGILKIINRQVFPLGVMYRRFPLTHEVIQRNDVMNQKNEVVKAISLTFLITITRKMTKINNRSHFKIVQFNTNSVGNKFYTTGTLPFEKTGSFFS